MNTIDIKHRWTNAVLWSGAAESVKDAASKAVAARADLARADLARANLADANLAGANLARANLAGANLARADLAGANLADANLAGANLARADLAGANLARADLAGADLAGAYLAGAYLAGAYLAGAYLAGANLARADLAGANLADANLAGADLAGAYLAGADLAGADLAGAYLAGADLAGAYLAGARNFVPGAHVDPVEPYVRRVAVTRAERAARYRADHPEIPFVEDLDKKILAAIEAGGSLEMGSWHSCDTTHCRAGWAIHLAGKAGYELERQLEDPEKAGRAIYLASAGYAPHFYASNEAAMADVRRRAAEVEAVEASAP